MSADDPTAAEKRLQAIELLKNNHTFPCQFLIKVIGRTENDFVHHVVRALREFQHSDDDPPYRTRETPNGKHVSVTFEPRVTSAEEVLDIYHHIQQVKGIVMVM